VGIIEDEKQIRESLTILINGSDGFSCENTFESAEDAIRELPSLKLDVVLVDIHLTGRTGIDCVARVKPICKQTQFLMCTSYEDTTSIFNALKAGASGYVTKTIQPSKLLDSIIEAHNGGSPMSGHIARKVVQSFHPNAPDNNPELQKLSLREREILDHLSKGLRYKEIADTLFLSTETVRKHIRNIYEKLQVNSAIEALNKVFGQKE